MAGLCPLTQMLTARSYMQMVCHLNKSLSLHVLMVLQADFSLARDSTGALLGGCFREFPRIRTGTIGVMQGKPAERPCHANHNNTEYFLKLLEIDCRTIFVLVRRQHDKNSAMRFASAMTAL
jgi:hypothetical protein